MTRSAGGEVGCVPMAQAWAAYGPPRCGVYSFGDQAISLPMRVGGAGEFLLKYQSPVLRDLLYKHVVPS